MFARVLNTQEYFDSPELIEEHALLVAQKLRDSQHAIAFCGAGLSTMSGIPDYRSGYQTILATGPGKWETDENKAKYTKTVVRRTGNEAWPNKGHLALSALAKEGYIKFVISQNVDGLLPRAGISGDMISELHGNIFTENCVTCGQEYWRDFSIPKWGTNIHDTGRKCDCGQAQPLHDTLIYFGDSLKIKEIEACWKKVVASDFCLVLGSSLQVTPASSYVNYFLKYKPEKSIAIVNLQKTHVHNKGSIEVHDLCDKFLEKVTNHLNLNLPEPIFSRNLKILESPSDPTKLLLTFLDDHGRHVQATDGFTLVSATGQTKAVADWPFTVSTADMLDYVAVRYRLLVDGSCHEVDVESLDRGRQHGIKYDDSSFCG